PYCPACGIPVGTQTADEIIDKILALPEGTKLYLMAPLERRGQERYDTLWDEVRRSGFVRLRVDGQSYSVEEPPSIDHRRQHVVEVIVDRVVVRSQAVDPSRSPRTRVADAAEAALELGRGVMHVAFVEDGKPEPQWRVEKYSQHFACERCGRSFERLNPHHFSFNSPLGWCPTCEGLGVQKGANTALLIRDTRRTLREGALSAWPDLTEDTPFVPFAEAIARHGGFDLDTPFENLTSEPQRLLLHGSGDWLERASRERKRPEIADRRSPVAYAPGSPVRFQYKGLFPALDEASRVSFVYRQRLAHLVDEVACLTR